MNNLKHVLILFFVFFVFLHSETFGFLFERDRVLVKTQSGVVSGIQRNNFYFFGGIPYAEPPLGSLRFSAPVPKKPWTGILDASKFGACCPQPRNLIKGQNTSEDCLFLNVFTPTLPQNSSSLRPVMVFIHGGGWFAGCSSQNEFHGDFIANSTNTVLVTINYRLGVLGFLRTPQLQGNFGFLDQVLALKWVQTNIESFGGDPRRVTIFGHSAGGSSVALHLSAPYSYQNNYFQRAIVQSNPFTIRFHDVESAIAVAQEFAIYVGCVLNDVECFRQLPLNTIMKYQLLTLPFPKKSTDLLAVIPWTPTIDNYTIIGQPLQLFRKGQFYKVPVIFGTVQNETLSFVYIAFELLGLKNFNLYEYEAMVYAFFGKSQAQRILEYYPGFGDARRALISLTTDYLMDCPTRYAALGVARSNVPIWVYHFRHSPVDDPENNSTFCRGAVCHGAELVYEFHSISFCPGFYQTPDEQRLSWQMMTYWTSFAHGSVPHPSNQPSNPFRVSENQSIWARKVYQQQQQQQQQWKIPPLIHWPRFNNTLQTLRLDIPLSVEIGYNKRNCDFWDTLGYGD